MNLIKKSMAVVMAMLLLACSSYGEKVAYNGTEVYFKDGVTQETADAVGSYLVEFGFADGTSKSVQITKDSLYNFRMVTLQKYHEDTSLDVNFQAIGFLLSKDVFKGEPINFVVCDASFNEVRSIYIKGAASTEE